jgi:hypothetical protein
MAWKALLALAFCLMSAQATSCDVDDDCRALNTCVDGVCAHKSLLAVHAYEWVSTFALILATAAAKSIAIGSKA